MGAREFRTAWVFGWLIDTKQIVDVVIFIAPIKENRKSERFNDLSVWGSQAKECVYVYSKKSWDCSFISGVRPAGVPVLDAVNV